MPADRPRRGAAASQQWYNRPTQTGSLVKHIGEGFHINRLPAERLHLCEVDADHWKTWVHQRLSTPIGQTGRDDALQAPPQEHLALAKHLTAETEDRGVRRRQGRGRRNGSACAGRTTGSMRCTTPARPDTYCGVRLVDEFKPKPEPRLTLRELFERGRGRSWGEA